MEAQSSPVATAVQMEMAETLEIVGMDPA